MRGARALPSEGEGDEQAWHETTGRGRRPTRRRDPWVRPRDR